MRLARMLTGTGIERFADVPYFESVTGYERRKQAEHKARNEELPAHLPRYEVILAASEAQATCPTHGERKPVGMDWQETLEVVPPKLIVRRTGIPKYACPKAPECGVVEAARPPAAPCKTCSRPPLT
jgi:transposase